MISVIVITHPEYEKYLPKTLETLKDCEVIVEHNPHGTLSAACNRAIERASGDYIIRVDSDDWIHPELLRLESEYLDHHPVDCVWCDYWKVFSDRTEYMAQPTLEHACGAMFRREVWEKLKYDESLHYQEAFDFWMRFNQEFKSHRIEQPLYYYRQHEGSMSKNVEEKIKVRQMILDKYVHNS